MRRVGIFSDSVIAFSWFWQWKNFENRLIFSKVKAYKKWCQFFGPPCTVTIPLSVTVWPQFATQILTVVEFPSPKWDRETWKLFHCPVQSGKNERVVGRLSSSDPKTRLVLHDPIMYPATAIRTSLLVRCNAVAASTAYTQATSPSIDAFIFQHSRIQS